MLVRTLDQLTPFEKLALIDISYSRLDTYDSCPAKYFYTYITKEERTFGPAAAMGNIVHSVLENTVGEDEDLDLGNMVRLFQHFRDEYDPEREISAELIDSGYSILTEFSDRHKGEKFDVLENEMKFSIVVGSALISGYIDMVSNKDDGIHIIDWKTGKWEYRGDPKENLQLGIYALATSFAYPGRPIHAELYYLRSGKRRGAWFTPDDLEAVKERLIDIVSGIIEDQNFSCTTNPRACISLCDFGKSGVCRTGAARIRR